MKWMILLFFVVVCLLGIILTIASVFGGGDETKISAALVLWACGTLMLAFLCSLSIEQSDEQEVRADAWKDNCIKAENKLATVTEEREDAIAKLESIAATLRGGKDACSVDKRSVGFVKSRRNVTQ